MRTFTAILLLTFLFSCDMDRSFPEVVRLSSVPGTAFSPTLEHSLDFSQNQVYASSLCYAWNEIEQKLGSDVIVDSPYQDLALLAASESFRGSLAKEEISTSIRVAGAQIHAKAFFKKSLPFEIELKRNPDELLFEGEEVESFGFDGEDEEICQQAKILYYENDYDFALKLSPEDPDQEIILCRTPLPGSGSFSSLIDTIQAKQKRMVSDSWRGYILKEDIVNIPVMAFNIEHNYATLEGSSFMIKGEPFEITECYQRTAFLIDEKGAEVESEAEIELAIEAAPDPNRPRPKHLVFDGPFLIMLKRVDTNYPYFACWVANEALLKKIE